MSGMHLKQKQGCADCWKLIKMACSFSIEKKRGGGK